MSLLFADIFEAIRYLRLCKGTTEKSIFDYVKERTGGCLTPAQILKTFRALQKLVDEGVLVKNGKRYTFPTKPKLPDDDEEEEEEEEKDCEEEQPEEEEEEDESSADDDDEEEDDDDDEEEEEEEDKCNECPSSGDDDDDDEEEDDDDDDSEEEEEDDDNGNDSEACDKTEMPEQPEEEKTLNETMGSEDNVVKAISANQNTMLVDKNNKATKVSDKRDGNVGGNTNPSPNTKQVTKKLGITQKGATNNDAGKTGFGKTEANKGGVGKHDASKHGANKYDEGAVNKTEARKTECKKTGAKKHEKKKSKVKTNNEPKSVCDNKEKPVTDAVNEKEKVKKRSQSKIRDRAPPETCQKQRSRKSRTKNPNHRGGSSVKKLKAAVYSMTLDHSLEFGSFSNTSQVCPESMETNLLLENDVEDNRADYALFPHRSPAGPPPPNAPGPHLNRKESCCSNNMDKFTGNEEIKMQSLYEEENHFSLTKSDDGKNSVLSVREDEAGARFPNEPGSKVRDKLKRDLSIEGDHLALGPFGDKSLCSVCKKKRIS